MTLSVAAARARILARAAELPAEEVAMSLEERVRQLEAQIAELKQCKHEFETVGGRNMNYRIFFNGTNAYIKCVKCGKRKQA